MAARERNEERKKKKFREAREGVGTPREGVGTPREGVGTPREGLGTPFVHISHLEYIY